MLTRIISGAVLVVLAIGILYSGGYVTGAAMLGLSLGGVFELLRVYKLHKSAMGYIAYAFTIVYYGLICFVSFFYVSVMLSFVYQIREMEYGGGFVVLIFICSWINDTFAYFTGVTIGKHKMCPKLSPKKSVEGLIGGLAGATVIGALYGIFFQSKVYDIKNCPLIFAIVGLLGAGAAVIGDLTASGIKRNNDVKDYGKLIPGHGGVLDRFDSMIFTAPMIYFGLYYLIPYFS